MHVDIRTLAALAPHEIMYRHAGLLSLDIPERHVNSGERVIEYRSLPPVGTYLGGQEDILDFSNVAASQKRVEVFLHRFHHGQRSLGEGGTAESIKSWLAGFQLDDDQPDPGRRGKNAADFLDRRGHQLPSRGRSLYDAGE